MAGTEYTHLDGRYDVVKPIWQNSFHGILKTFFSGDESLVQHGVPWVMSWPVLARQFNSWRWSIIRSSPYLKQAETIATNNKQETAISSGV